MHIPLNIKDNLPDGFFKATPHSLFKLMPNGTLVTLKGKIKKPLFISCLLHGNETSSFFALQQLLQEYEELPRSLILFFGNLEAAAQGKRHLENQVDYNRIWNGQNSPEEKLAQEVLAFAKKSNVWASIDIHNNTGTNPYYICLSGKDAETLKLASMFSHNIIYFEEPKSVLSKAFMPMCPSVTLECGKSGDTVGVARIVEFLKAVMELESFEEAQMPLKDLNVYHSIAHIHLERHLEVDFNFKKGTGAHFSFLEDLDHLNFKKLVPGTVLAYTSSNQCLLQIWDNEKRDITSEYLSIREGKLVVIKEFTPSMLTKDLVVAKDDCLGYLMQD